MNTTATPLKPRLHPLVATAALAVTAFSIAGIAALTGLLPMTRAATGQTAGQATLAAAPQAARSTSAVPPAPTFSSARDRTTTEAAARPVARRVSQIESAPLIRAADSTSAVPPAVAAQPALCTSCGTIDSVREVAQDGAANGLGAIVGGLLGGILGNQVGKGGGNTVATVIGAAGGAYAGHQFEKSRNKAVRYEIGVRMNDGTLRSFTEERVPAWRIGERVRIENGVLQHDSGNAPLSYLPRQAI